MEKTLYMGSLQKANSLSSRYKLKALLHHHAKITLRNKFAQTDMRKSHP